MKLLHLAITLLFMCYITNASTIDETKFSEQGYSNFYINGSDSFDCAKYEFIYSKDINAQVFPVISLKVDFFPNSDGKAEIITYFNDDNVLAELKPTDFTNGFARIPLIKEKMKENNVFRVCAKTSYSINKIGILADSYFGVYSMPYFSKINGFKLKPETYRPFENDPFDIEIVALNSGSEDVEITIKYRKDQLEEYLEEISVLKGETSKTGIIPKCKEYANNECSVPGEFKQIYTVVANKAVPMTLLPATMEYTNIFGEKVNMLTDRPSIEAIIREHEISGQIILSSDSINAGEKITAKIKLKNQGKTKINNLKTEIKSGLEIIGENSKEISSIDPGKEETVIFEATGITAGNYVVGCEIFYNEKSFSCTEADLIVKTEKIKTEILAGIGFLIVSLAVFAYFYFKKK